jgi:hypothetical protein
MSRDAGGFMYLKLEYRTREESGRQSISDEGLWAAVSSDGDIPHSVGGPHSKHRNSPLAVFQLAGFDGLGAITDSELISELTRRMKPPEFLARMGWEFEVEDLMLLLAARNGASIQRIPKHGERSIW